MSVDAAGRSFLDTNVIVYTFDDRDRPKQLVARGLVGTALQTGRGAISSQVVQEFLSVALRKFEHPLSVPEAREYVALVLTPLCAHFPTLSFYDHALLVRNECGLSFYDSLILTAAIEARCDTMYSEDFAHGTEVRGVRVVNPFVGGMRLSS